MFEKPYDGDRSESPQHGRRWLDRLVSIHTPEAGVLALCVIPQPSPQQVLLSTSSVQVGIPGAPLRSVSSVEDGGVHPRGVHQPLRCTDYPFRDTSGEAWLSRKIAPTSEVNEVLHQLCFSRKLCVLKRSFFLHHETLSN